MSVLFVLVISVGGATAEKYMSAVGDPGMKRDGLRVAFEAWNFCNEVGQEAPHMGSPRAADCFDLTGKSTLLFTFSSSFFLFLVSFLIACCNGDRFFSETQGNKK